MYDADAYTFTRLCYFFIPEKNITETHSLVGRIHFIVEDGNTDDRDTNSINKKFVFGCGAGKILVNGCGYAMCMMLTSVCVWVGVSAKLFTHFRKRANNTRI